MLNSSNYNKWSVSKYIKEGIVFKHCFIEIWTVAMFSM